MREKILIVPSDTICKELAKIMHFKDDFIAI